MNVYGGPNHWFFIVFEVLRAMVNDGLEVNNGLRLQCAAMNIKDDWQWHVRLYYKRASSRLRIVIVTTRKTHSF